MASTMPVSTSLASIHTLPACTYRNQKFPIFKSQNIFKFSIINIRYSTIMLVKSWKKILRKEQEHIPLLEIE
ncbi:hypothetical protein Hanom_Chr09g00807351 [Helianthus anomalus]